MPDGLRLMLETFAARPSFLGRLMNFTGDRFLRALILRALAFAQNRSWVTARVICNYNNWAHL